MYQNIDLLLVRSSFAADISASSSLLRGYRFKFDGLDDWRASWESNA